MGFKTKPRYKLVRENIVGKDMVQSRDEYVISKQKLKEMTFGMIPFSMFELINDWLDEE